MRWRVDDAAPEQTVSVEWLRRELGNDTDGSRTGDGPAVGDGDVDGDGPADGDGPVDGDGPASEDVERTFWTGVRWVQKNGAHWLLHDETPGQHSGSAPGGYTRQSRADESTAADQTVLVLRPSQLTWIRRGSVKWRHEFRVDEEHESAMLTGAGALAVLTRTHWLELSVTGRGGDVVLHYTMDLGGMTQTVAMTIRFTKED